MVRPPEEYMGGCLGSLSGWEGRVEEEVVAVRWPSFLMGILHPITQPARRWTVWDLSLKPLPGQSFGLKEHLLRSITTEKYLPSSQPFSTVVSTWAICKKLLSSFLHLGTALATPIPPLETSEPADGCDRMAFQGIPSVSFMSVISVRNRKLFSHLIHLIDKMRN